MAAVLARVNTLPHQRDDERGRSRQPALLAPVPRPDVARSARSTTASSCSPTSRIPRCATSASNCLPTAPGHRPTSSNSSASRSAPAAASAKRSTPTRRRRALEGVFGAERRIELGWMVGDGKLPKGAVKLLLNLALLAGDALVRGGRLDVGAERSDEQIELADPRRGAANPARPGASRDAGQRRERRGRSSRARPAPGSRTASRPKPAARSGCPIRRARC